MSNTKTYKLSVMQYILGIAALVSYVAIIVWASLSFFVEVSGISFWGIFIGYVALTVEVSRGSNSWAILPEYCRKFLHKFMYFIAVLYIFSHYGYWHLALIYLIAAPIVWRLFIHPKLLKAG